MSLTSSQIVDIFKGVTVPELYLDQDGLVVVPEEFSIRIGKSNRILALLGSTSAFHDLQDSVKKGILDCLYLLFQRAPHNAIRFQNFSSETTDANDDAPHSPEPSLAGKTLPRIFLSLFDSVYDDEDLSISLRIIRLFIVIRSARTEVKDMRDILARIKISPELSIAWLYTLKALLKPNEMTVGPVHFFNMGGAKAGLFSVLQPTPFQREYHVITWFRLETLGDGDGIGRQSIVSFGTPDAGVEVCVVSDRLLIIVKDANGESKFQILGPTGSSRVLKRGVWYHLSVKHCRPSRMSLFGADDLCVCIDHEIHHQSYTRFPVSSQPSGSALFEFTIGANFDGQIGPVYFFSEAMAAAVVEVIASLDCGKQVSEELFSAGSSYDYPDLIPTLTMHDRKVHSISSKIVASYHPTRCAYSHVLDIHGGRHARIGADTFCSKLVDVRDYLVSIGGISCLLPLFPKLLIESTEGDARTPLVSPTSSPNQTAKKSQDFSDIRPKPSPSKHFCVAQVDLFEDSSSNGIFESTTLSGLESTETRFGGISFIGLLLEITAECLSNHPVFQLEMVRVGGIDLIEYVLLHASPDLFLCEDEDACLLGLKQFIASAQSVPLLENAFMKRIAFNFNIWKKAGYGLQKRLYQFLLFTIIGRIDYFTELVGLQALIDSISFHFMDSGGTMQLSGVESTPSEGGAVVSDVVISSNPTDSVVVSNDNSVGGFPRPSVNDTFGMELPSPVDSIIDEDDGASLTLSPRMLRRVHGGVEQPLSTKRASKFKKVVNKVIKLAKAAPSTLSLILDSEVISGDVSSSTEILSGVDNSQHASTKAPEAGSSSPRLSRRGLNFKNVVELAIKQASISMTPREAPLGPASDHSGVAFAKQIGRELSGDSSADASSAVVSPYDDVMYPLPQSLSIGSSQEQSSPSIALSQELSKVQRQEIRLILFKMILHMVNFSQYGEVQFKHLLSFVVFCKDSAVLVEITQLVTQLISCGEDKLILAVVDLFGGAEEFSSCLLVKLIQNTSEEVRCSGLRLLSGFYFRLTSLTGLAVAMSSRAHKGNTYLLSMDKLVLTGDRTNHFRLLMTGSLTLISEIWSEFYSSSTVRTYAALLELLLYKSTASTGPVAVDIVERFNSSEAIHFADYYLRPDQSVDEDRDMTNSVVLPLFFRALTAFPFQVLEQALGDLLSLLKNSAGNRAAFFSSVSWHNHLFTIALRYYDKRRFDYARKVTESLQISRHFSQRTGTESGKGSSSKKMSLSVDTSREYIGIKINDTSDDVWFSVVLKIFSTLLMHGLDTRHGWCEVMRAVSLAWSEEVKHDAVRPDFNDTVRGRSVANAVLSQLINDATLSMKKGYPELKRRVKSTNSKRNKEALTYLENVLSVFITGAEYALDSLTVSTMSVPSMAEARMRLDILSTLEKQGSSSGDVSSLHEEAVAQMEELLVLCLTNQLPASSASSLEDSLTNDGFNATFVREVRQKLISFEWTWLELRSTGKSGSASTQSSPRSRATTPRESSTSSSIDSELSPVGLSYNNLSTLDPNHSLEEGRMILVLQSLRLFDAVFWARENLPLRNNHMLKFMKASAGQSTTKGDTAKLYGFTLVSVAFRCSLYVLDFLSPYDNLACANALRLRGLISACVSETHIPRQTTMVNEWRVAVAVHVTVALQRVTSCLGPVFQTMGLAGDVVEVVLAGCPESEYFEREQFRQHNESEYFVLLKEDQDRCCQIHHLFDDSQGRALLRFIHACFSVVVALVAQKSSTDALAQCLDKATLLNLTSFSQFILEKSRTLEPTTADNSELFSNDNGDDDVVLSRAGGLTPMDKDDVEDGDAILDDCLVSEEKTRSPKTFSFLSKPSLSVPSSDRETTEPLIVLSVIDTLHALRHTYLRTSNLTRNVHCVRSLISLEAAETSSSKQYFSDMESIRSSLSRSSDPLSKYADEAAQLRDLSTAVLSTVSTRVRSQVSAHRLLDEAHFKNSAARWLECFRRFESPWSPWYSMEDEEALRGEKGIAQYELSRDCDTRLRRFILTKLDEVRDHSKKSYFESRQRDLQDHLDSLANPLASSTSKIALPPMSKFQKLNWIKDATAETNADDSNTLDLDCEAELEEAENMTKRGVEIMGIDLSLLLPGSGDQESRRPYWTQPFTWAADEKIQFFTEVIQIKLEFRVDGDLLMTNKYLYFRPKELIGGHGVGSDADFKACRWSLDRLCDLFSRRYIQKNCAVELFFIDSTELLFAFDSSLELHKFCKKLKAQNTPFLAPLTAASLNPQQAFTNSMWTDLWKRRLISNFEYLMRLNMAAGRSYNDLTQYPVFPWVIRDYTSSYLDLSDPATFRDLSKPMGAQDPVRLESFLSRYQAFEEDGSLGPAFHYGSHYSTEGFVLYYLLRQEPFTTMGLTLQGGRFDCPDRVFFDVKRAWDGCSKLSVSDVKELIPEFFCCPEFLINSNNLPLGELQEGGSVGDVQLPPWASNAFEFVRINREALESEYVSAHLSDWIDLVFGYKQRGEAAIQACNLFHYLTYDGAVDMDKIDINDKRAVEAQIMHYGQSPAQLFKKAHPRRLPREECMAPLFSDCSAEALAGIKIFSPKQGASPGAQHGAIIAIQSSHDRLVTYHADHFVNYFRWSSFPDSDNNPFQVRPDRAGKTLPSANLSVSEEVLRQKSFVPLHPSTAAVSGIASGSGRRKSQIYSSDSAREVSPSVSPFDDHRQDTSDADLQPKKSQSRSLFGSIKKGWGDMAGQNSSEASESHVPRSVQTPRNMYVLDEHLFDPQSSLATKCFDPLLSKPLPVNTHKKVALSVDMGVGRILTAGYWDNTVKVHALDTLREMSSCSGGHSGAISVVELSHQGGHVVVTGGEDCTCRVWVMESASLVSAFSGDGEVLPTSHADTRDSETLTCIHVLWGHVAPISALSYCSDLDLIVSASIDGILCLHTARQGKFVRTISDLEGSVIDLVLVASAGYLLAHSWTTGEMSSFWINGNLLASTRTERVDCWAVNGQSTVLVCGCNNGFLAFRSIWDLNVLRVLDLSLHGAVSSLWFTEDMQYLLIGCKDGSFSVATNPTVRWRMLHVAIQKTPLLGSTI